MFLPKITSLPSLDVIGKQTPRIATELLGSASRFRELAEKARITPFTAESVISQIGQIPDVQRIQKEVGVIGANALKELSQLKKTVKDSGIKIDWLN